MEVFGISETKIDDSFPDAQFVIDEYRMFRRDRTQYGGGVVAYVRSDIPCRRMKCLETSSVEMLSIEVIPNKSFKCLIMIAYKPPSLSNQTFTVEMSDAMDRAQLHYDNIYVLGDLNFDYLDSAKSGPLIDLCEQYDLNQLIEGSTNHTIYGSTLIDVLLTNNSSSCIHTGNVNMGLSDSHNFIYAVLNIKAPRMPAKIVTYRNFKLYNEDSYAKDIASIPTTACDIFDDPSDNYWLFQTLLRNIMDEHAPLKRAKVRAKDTPFMNRQLRIATRNKARLHKKFKRFPNNKNWENYRKQRNLTTSIRKSAIKDYFRNKCGDGQKNPDFWNTVKPFLTNKGSANGSNIMIRSENCIETKPQEVANLMNDFYVNIIWI